MRNKFVYSCGVKKICALGFDKLLENIFCHLLVVEGFSLQKVVKMTWKSGSQLMEGRWIWWMSQNSVAQFIQLLKHCLCNMQSGIVAEKPWVLSIEQMLAAGIAVFGAFHQFADHTSQVQWFHRDSESCGGSDRQQTTKQWLWPFFGSSLALGSALELLSPTTKLVVV